MSQLSAVIVARHIRFARLILFSETLVLRNEIFTFILSVSSHSGQELSLVIERLPLTSSVVVNEPICRQSNVRRVPVYVSPKPRRCDVISGRKMMSPMQTRLEARHRPYPTQQTRVAQPKPVQHFADENIYESIDDVCVPVRSKVAQTYCERLRDAHQCPANDIPSLYFATSSSSASSSQQDDHHYETPPYLRRRPHSRGSRHRHERDVSTHDNRNTLTKDYGWIDSAPHAQVATLPAAGQAPPKKRVCFQTWETNV